MECAATDDTATPARPADDAAHFRQVRQDLRQASQDHAFALMFQPRLALKSGAVCGVQAHLRWPRRRGGRTPAGAFVPLLDQCGVADEVAAWMLGAACQAARAWPDLPVCIGVPASCLRQGSLLGHIGHALAESGLPAENLHIELTATMLSGDATDTLLALAALRDRGVGIVLDEFGQDTACLLTLKNLPLTAVKLDRTLVRDLATDQDATALATAAIHFAHALGIHAVANGLETQAQRTTLRRAGCDQAQGAYCGRLMGAETLRVFLRQDRTGAVGGR
jgi:EAL domain-containing protein (putative c-di-GMP-specific phosphodiesterase class I)